jgi:hypothetical protein
VDFDDDDDDVDDNEWRIGLILLDGDNSSVS